MNPPGFSTYTPRSAKWLIWATRLPSPMGATGTRIKVAFSTISSTVWALV